LAFATQKLALALPRLNCSASCRPRLAFATQKLALALPRLNCSASLSKSKRPVGSQIAGTERQNCCSCSASLNTPRAEPFRGYRTGPELAATLPVLASFRQFACSLHSRVLCFAEHAQVYLPVKPSAPGPITPNVAALALRSRARAQRSRARAQRSYALCFAHALCYAHALCVANCRNGARTGSYAAS